MRSRSQLGHVYYEMAHYDLEGKIVFRKTRGGYPYEMIPVTGKAEKHPAFHAVFRIIQFCAVF